jgi:hypothetical protein
MTHKFHGDGIRHNCGLELACGGVPKRMENDFTQLAHRAAAFASAVMAALFSEACSHENFMKLVAQVSSAALAFDNCEDARK